MNILKPLAAALLLAGPAVAQDHAGHMSSGQGPSDAAMAGHMAAMDKMMGAMHGMAATGNPDADFLIMMIPHHQSAIDMAEVELEYGKDAATRDLAKQIIAAQTGEIAEMKAMLKAMGVPAPD